MGAKETNKNVSAKLWFGRRAGPKCTGAHRPAAGTRRVSSAPTREAARAHDSGQEQRVEGGVGWRDTSSGSKEGVPRGHTRRRRTWRAPVNSVIAHTQGTGIRVYGCVEFPAVHGRCYRKFGL